MKIIITILFSTLLFCGCSSFDAPELDPNVGPDVIRSAKNTSEHLEQIGEENEQIQKNTKSGKEKAPDLKEFVFIESSSNRIGSLVDKAQEEVEETKKLGNDVIELGKRYSNIIKELKAKMQEQAQEHQAQMDKLNDQYQSQIAELKNADNAAFRKTLMLIMAGCVIVLIAGVLGTFGTPMKRLGVSLSVAGGIGISICLALLRFQSSLEWMGLIIIGGLFLAACIGLAVFLWIRYRDKIRESSIYKEMAQRFEIAASARDIEDAKKKVRENRPENLEADREVRKIKKPNRI